MNFQEFCIQRERMCKTKENCNECIFGKENNSYDTCLEYIMAHPKQAETYVEEWITAHPMVTNSDKFKEIFNVELCASHDNPGYFFFLKYDRPMSESDAITWLEAEYKESKGE